MQEVLIPIERAEILSAKYMDLVESKCKCEISIKSKNIVDITGDAYDEFLARNVIFAFGRGFDINTALKLLNDDMYFESMNITDFAKNKNRRSEIKGRIIGNSGKAKIYVEDVSGAYISVYGDTVSFIGKSESIIEAKTAVYTIIEGGSHRLAYKRMEATHKKFRKSLYDDFNGSTK